MAHRAREHRPVARGFADWFLLRAPVVLRKTLPDDFYHSRPEPGRVAAVGKIRTPFFSSAASPCGVLMSNHDLSTTTNLKAFTANRGGQPAAVGCERFQVRRRGEVMVGHENSARGGRTRKKRGSYFPDGCDAARFRAAV